MDTADPSPTAPEDLGGPSYDESKRDYAGISSGTLHSIEDLRDARAFAEMIVDTVREGLLVLDFDLCVVAANESFYQAFKGTPEDTVGALVYDLGNGQWDLPELRELLEDILPREKTFDGYEVDHVFEELGRRVMVLNARRLDDHQLVLLAIEDATERRRGEEDLELAREDLHTARARLGREEQMASLGRLAAGIAHEIKNPLNFVTNFAEITLELLGELRRANADGDRAAIAALLEDVESNSRKVQEHGQRANAIVQQMMDLARSMPSESKPRRSVDVNALVREQVAMAVERRRAGRPKWTCRVVEDLGAETGALTASSHEIARVVQSLLQNALDAIDERADSATGPYEPVLRVQTRREGGDVSIAVTDNGPGIAPPLRQRVFEPFYTTKSPRGGHSGLGLSLAHETAVGGYGGQLEVESEEGVGSTFTVRLPAA